MFDACGLAGGGHVAGGFGGTYFNTSRAKQGDYGSELPPLPTGTVWTAGQAVEVAWAPYANHGEISGTKIRTAYHRPALSFVRLFRADCRSIFVTPLRVAAGGGYQYQLAKKDGPLTEVEFQKTPLAFIGSQALRWGGRHSERENITGTYVTKGVVPKGSTWACGTARNQAPTRLPQLLPSCPWRVCPICPPSPPVFSSCLASLT